MVFLRVGKEYSDYNGVMSSFGGECSAAIRKSAGRRRWHPVREPSHAVEQVIEHFGQPGRFFIGGIATSTLTFGRPEEIRAMVHGLYAKAGEYPGFKHMLGDTNTSYPAYP